MYLVSLHECETNLQVKSQGLIKSTATIESLKRRGVKSIIIDADKSVHASHVKSQTDITKLSKENDVSVEHKPALSPQILDFAKHQEHLAKADKLYTQARALQSRFIKQLRSGDAPDFDVLNAMCQDVIDSVFENNEALSCLVMLKDTSDYLVEHSLNCAILLSMFATHRGMTQAEIEDLTLSGLLMDLGMALLPDELAARQDEYSQADLTLMRSHVDIGAEIVERYADLPPMVREVILNHHERVDGSGYPKQKSGEAVSIYAQMAGLVDTYDAMITDRKFRSSRTAQDVLEKLETDASFDSELVEAFIAAIGLYPVGALVHLSSGKLAIVVQKHPKYPLKPKVMSFYSIRNKMHTEVKLTDLSKSSDKIKSVVRPEEFDLNLPQFFKKVFRS